MTDLHDGFTAWLTQDSHDDLPRDLAVHASGCDVCMARIAAFDALAAIDPAHASPPPVRVAVAGAQPWGPSKWMRAVAGATAMAVVVAAGILVGANLIGPRTDAGQIAAATSTPGEGILGGVGGPGPTPAQRTTASATSSGSPRPEPSVSPSGQPPVTAGGATPNPTMGGGPPPISSLPPTPTPRPATPAPSTTAAPTPVPTAVPTPIPTETPAPTPLPECSNGIDDDGDGGIDYGLDPVFNDLECVSPEDPSEGP